MKESAIKQKFVLLQFYFTFIAVVWVVLCHTVPGFLIVITRAKQH